MRYLILSVIIILTVFGLYQTMVDETPDKSVETDQHRVRPSVEGNTKQAQEDKSLPRHE